MKQSHRIITSIILITILAWSFDLWLYPIPWKIYPIRKELINVTGVIAFVMMSMIMLLAVRPKWLDQKIGLDKMYHLHKWAGIWAIIFAGLHYGIKLAKPLLLYFVEQGPKLKGAKPELTGIAAFLNDYTGVAKIAGEYIVYFLLVVLVLTLWQKFSYKFWRYLHKLMGPVFLILAFHAVILTPWNYWTQPIGLWVAFAIILGSICALISIFGLIGQRHTFSGTITSIKHYNNLVEVTCQLSGQWQHQAGQYAFFKHDALEGAHPFTISSSDQGDNIVRFSIKALGDYTNHLQTHLKINDKVEIEGPYGLFNYQDSNATQQIWIGAGIGITPFIAWVESMIQNKDHSKQVDLYYCIRDEEEAIYAQYLNQLCSQLPNVNLHIHYSNLQGYLTPDILIQNSEHTNDIWFCGPNAFIHSLKSGFKTCSLKDLPTIHQEIFQMR